MDAQTFMTLCIYILAGLLGLCVGSFLNVVIYRLPREMSLSKPSSHCTSCGYSLKWYDNVPVLSYLFLRGRCRKCKTKISPRYMLVEMATALLWLLSVWRFWNESIPMAVVGALASCLLLCIFFIDLEHLLIFNRFVILLGACGLVTMQFDAFTAWQDHVIGAAVGGGFFYLVYVAALHLFKREGLGFGDVKYAAAAGFLLGWQKLLLAMLLASVSASVVLLSARKIRGDAKDTEYPLGPFLAVGTLIALFFGNQLIDGYLQLLLG